MSLRRNHLQLFKWNVLIDLLLQYVQHPRAGLGIKISFFFLYILC